MKCIVYGLYSSRNPNELRYVGQTTRCPQRRLSQHLCYAKRRRTAVQLWMWRELEAGHQVTLKVLAKDAVFNKTEMEVIERVRRDGARLLNHTDGGGGVLGHVQSEDTRRKKSAIAKRFWDAQTERVRWRPTEEQKRKIGEANIGNKSMLGQKHSEETKRKMREWAANNREWLKARNLGRKYSEESKAKMSEARRLYWERRRNAQASI